MEAAVQDGGRETLTGGTFLCRLAEIGDPGAKGFPGIDGRPDFFVVRRGDRVFGYRNSCPHYGAPLDWKPDAFLSYDRDMILCSMHGALFRIDDGICLSGPCPGQSLEPINIEVFEGNIFIV